MQLIKVAAFGLRGMSAAAKFLLVMYIASAGSAELLGQVAIITAITTLFSQVAGLEINQVIGRRLHALNSAGLVQILRSQAIICFGAYVLLVPVALFSYTDIFAPYWASIILILILEHLITEAYRLNILLLRPVFASCLLFIKNVGWVILFVGISEINREKMTFELMLNCWAVVLILTGLPLALFAWNRNRSENKSTLKTSIKKIPALMSESIPFIACSIFTAFAGTIDKIIIGKYFSISELGIFFFFSTFASILSLVVTFSVGSTTGPECIKVHTTQGLQEFLVCLSKLKKQYLITISITAFLVIITSIPTLIIMEKISYFPYFWILISMVISAGFLALCDPFKLEEYLSKRDSSLVIGNAFHLISLVIGITISSLTSNINFVAIGIMLSSILTFIFFAMRGPRKLAQLFNFINNTTQTR